MFNSLCGWMAGRREGGKRGINLGKGLRWGAEADAEEKWITRVNYLVRKMPDFIEFLRKMMDPDIHLKNH